MTREEADRWYRSPCPGGDGHETQRGEPTYWRGDCYECILSALAAPSPAEAPGAREELGAILREIQRYQPGGSPPPGGPAVLAAWVLRSLHDGAAPAFAAPAPPDRCQCGTYVAYTDDAGRHFPLGHVVAGGQRECAISTASSSTGRVHNHVTGEALREVRLRLSPQPFPDDEGVPSPAPAPVFGDRRAVMAPVLSERDALAARLKEAEELLRKVARSKGCPWCVEETVEDGARGVRVHAKTCRLAAFLAAGRATLEGK